MRLTKGYYWDSTKYANFKEFILEKRKRRKKNTRHTKVLYRYEEVYYRDIKLWEGFNPYNRWNEPLPGSENKIADLAAFANVRTVKLWDIPFIILWFMAAYFIFFDAQTLNLYGAYNLICVDHHSRASYFSFRLLMFEEGSLDYQGGGGPADIRSILLEIALS